MLLVFFVYFLFAVTFMLAKGALAYVNPILLIGVRMVIAGTLVLGIAAARREWRRIESLRVLVLFGSIIFFHIYCAYLCEFWALQWVSASKASLIYNLSPFVTAILSSIFLAPDDRVNQLSRKKLLGLGIGLLGMFSWFGLEVSQSWFGLSLPDCALVISVVSASYGWLVMRRLTDTFRYSQFFINGIGMFFGGVLALITSAFVEGRPFVKAISFHHPPPQFVLALFGSYYASALLALGYILLLVLIANIVCYNIYAHLLNRYSATFLSFAGFLCPLFTSLLNALVYSEPPTLQFIMTLAIMSMGLLVFYNDELRIYRLTRPAK